MILTSQPTVHVEPIAGYANALKMTWQHKVYTPDVPTAFRAITAFLDTATGPVYVVVDLLSDPVFPLHTTIPEALHGPFRHPMMGEWLVIGTNWMAQTIEKVLVAVTHRKIVRWFDSEAEALAYLDGAARSAPPANAGI